MRRHKTRKIIIAMALLLAACSKHDDFDFTGDVVDYEECGMGYSSFGYAISLSAPDSLGGDYITRGNKHYTNVIVVYGADRQLRENDKVSGKMYLDPNYSKTTCDYHYTRNCPEGVFTKLEVIK